MSDDPYRCKEVNVCEHCGRFNRKCFRCRVVQKTTLYIDGEKSIKFGEKTETKQIVTVCDICLGNFRM